MYSLDENEILHTSPSKQEKIAPFIYYAKAHQSIL